VREKRKYEIKKWRERMAGAKHDKKVTKPKEKNGGSQKKTKKEITLNLN
jgi:hypothetical protein